MLRISWPPADCTVFSFVSKVRVRTSQSRPLIVVALINSAPFRLVTRPKIRSVSNRLVVPISVRLDRDGKRISFDLQLRTYSYSRVVLLGLTRTRSCRTYCGIIFHYFCLDFGDG